MNKMIIKKICLLFLLSGWLMLGEAEEIEDGFLMSMQSNECADQQGECRLYAAQGGAVVLSFDQKIEALRPFTVRLDLSEWPAEIETIELNFKMAAMDMGKNRYRLLKQADGRWQSRVVLPLCGAGGSEWLVEIQIKSSGGHWSGRVPFRLQSKS